MSCKIEVAQLKYKVQRSLIEETVVSLLEANKFRSNSIVFPEQVEELKEFTSEIHSIAFNDIPVS
jgi:Tfp pilus assembly PilM family ATPase